MKYVEFISLDSREKLLNALKSHTVDKFGRKKVCNLDIHGFTITNEDSKLISGTEFTNTRIENVIFDNVTMENCYFLDSYLTDTEFKQCKISDSGFTDETGFYKVKFKASDLNHVDFSFSKFSRSIFEECDLDYLNFDRSYISSASWAETPAFFMNCRFYKIRSYLPYTTIILDRSTLVLSSRLVSNSKNLKDISFKGAYIIGIHPDQMVHSVGPIGRRDDYTLYIPSIDFVRCGCFDGSLKEFQDQVLKTYPDGKYHDQYMAAIQLFKVLKDQYHYKK